MSFKVWFSVLLLLAVAIISTIHAAPRNRDDDRGSKNKHAEDHTHGPLASRTDEPRTEHVHGTDRPPLNHTEDDSADDDQKQQHAPRNGQPQHGKRGRRQAGPPGVPRDNRRPSEADDHTKVPLALRSDEPRPEHVGTDRPPLDHTDARSAGEDPRQQHGPENGQPPKQPPQPVGTERPPLDPADARSAGDKPGQRGPGNGQIPPQSRRG